MRWINDYKGCLSVALGWDQTGLILNFNMKQICRATWTGGIDHRELWGGQTLDWLRMEPPTLLCGKTSAFINRTAELGCPLMDGDSRVTTVFIVFSLLESQHELSGSPQNFSPPNLFAQNAVRPGFVRPPVLNVQGPFALILCMYYRQIWHRSIIGHVWC